MHRFGVNNIYINVCVCVCVILVSWNQVIPGFGGKKEESKVANGSCHLIGFLFRIIQYFLRGTLVAKSLSLTPHPHPSPFATVK